MGSNHSKPVGTKGGDKGQQPYQQPNAPNPDCARRHTSKPSRASSRHPKRARTSSRRTVYLDLTTSTTILSHYANRHAIEKVLKEKLGESLIRTVDGASMQQWRIEVSI